MKEATTPIAPHSASTERSRKGATQEEAIKNINEAAQMCYALSTTIPSYKSDA